MTEAAQPAASTATYGAASDLTISQVDAEGTDELRASLAWLIRLRWIAIAGLFVSLAVANLTDWTHHLLKPVAAATALAAGNVVAWLWLRRRAPEVPLARLRWAVLLQLTGDLVVLSVILRWTGGIVNPFAMFAIFPVAIAAILLPGWMAIACSVTAFLLFAGLVACELVATNPDTPLQHPAQAVTEFLEHPTFLVALMTATAMTMACIVYFVHSLVRRHREAEEHRRQHERIAQSRERMARVGLISAGVAHSVRNPLHGVINCLDLIRRSGGPEETEEVLSLMGEGLSRIEQVTTRLLALSRDKPHDPVETDLAEVVTQTLQLLEVRLQNRGIEVRSDLPNVPRIRLDPLRLQEALFNILDNAAAAVRDQPRRRVDVRLKEVSEPVHAVVLEVEDTGPGVDPEVQARVFDPFFSTKPVGEGTGLGLAIAKEVVEAHGGEIRFHSTPKQGTTVRILLPTHFDGGRA